MIKNPSFSMRLFLLAPVSLLPAAAITTQGQLWVESFHQTYQHDAQGAAVDKSLQAKDSYNLSRLDLDFGYKVSESFEMQARVGLNHLNNSALRDDRPTFDLPVTDFAQIKHFYGRYHSPFFGKIDSGLIPAPQISATSQQPSIFTVDPNAYHVIAFSGNHPGIAVHKDFGPVLLELGLWQQTFYESVASFYNPSIGADSFDTFAATDFLDSFLPAASYHQRALKLGFASVLHYYPVDSSNSGVAFNLGYQSRPLEMPLIFGTVAVTGDASTSIYSLSACQALNESSLAVSAYLGRFAFQAQAQYQVLGLAHQFLYGTATAQQELYSDLFARDSYGIGYNATIGYHFQGGYYGLNRESGQLKRHGHGFDVALSYGGVVQKNGLALLSELGRQDYAHTSFGTQGSGDYVTGQGRVAVTYGPETPLQGHAYTYIAVDSTYPRAAYNEDNSTDGFNVLQQNVGSSTYRAFQIRTQMYMVDVSYAYSDDLVFQIELQQCHHQAQIFSDASNTGSYVDAPLSAHYQYLRTKIYVTF